MGIASLVLGIVSIIIGFVPLCGSIAFIPALIGLILGIIDTIKKSKTKEKKGDAIAGTVLCALAVAIIGFWIGITLIGENTLTSALENTVNQENKTNGTETKEQTKRYIEKDETIKEKDWEIKIAEVKFGQRIDPPTKPLYYTYYQVKNTDNTYLCIALECKNISELELSADDIATVKVKYNDKYNYSSFSTIEDGSFGFTYTNITSIDPLTSKKVYYLAEMPRNIENEEDTLVEIEIRVNNNSYYYKLR